MRNALLAILVLVLGAGVGLYLNRKAVILYLATATGKVEVGPHREIDWDQGPSQSTVGPDERPPNIVFILADDLGINDISTFGGGVAGGRVPTPNIDRLARDGAVFEQAYAGTASCAPSRAMILTGRYPTRTGFEFTPTPNNMERMVKLFEATELTGLPEIELNPEAAAAGVSYQDKGLPGSEITVAEVLKDAGYHTVHIGKWHLGRGAEFSANAQGFDESLLMDSGLYLPEDHPDVVNAKLEFDPVDKFLWARMQFSARFNDGEAFAPGGYITDYWTDEAIKVIEANAHRPFFLYLAHWGVHTPLQATRADYEAVGDIEPERLRVYAAMVRSVDRSVGRVIEALEAQGLDDNTLIVFSSDNGGANYVSLPDINAPYRGWKLTMFEGGLRVPMFARWPARIEAGTRVLDPVTHVDLMPTFARAAGAQLPRDRVIDGVDMFAETPDAGPGGREAIFWRSAHYRAVRAGDWKLQITGRPAKNWLYNLAQDPTERDNLAEAEPARLAALTALLDAYDAQGRAPLYPYGLEAPIAVDRVQAERVQPGDDVVFWPN